MCVRSYKGIIVRYHHILQQVEILVGIELCLTRKVHGIYSGMALPRIFHLPLHTTQRNSANNIPLHDNKNNQRR